MTDHIFQLGEISPLSFFGTDNLRLNSLRSAFPRLRITARGDALVVAGDDEEIDRFQEQFERVLSALSHRGELSQREFAQLLLSADPIPAIQTHSDSVLLHGPNGLVVRARTPNQLRMVQLSSRNDILFAVGPAGSGKTYTAVALAVRALKDKEVRKIILTRPAVEAGESLGFLPGDLREKIDPYLRPLYDALGDMIPAHRLEKYLEEQIIEVAPLAFMRGRTLDKAFVILDEAQNCTEMQIKMFLTRMGPSAKFIITGDLTQIDLPPRQRSGLPQALHLLEGVKGIAQVFLSADDVVRHPLVRTIVEAYGRHDEARQRRAADREQGMDRAET